MVSNKLTLLILIKFFLILTMSHQMKQTLQNEPTNLLDPTVLKPYMFTEEISGKVNIMAQ
jgi:hypothetical protein